MAVWWYGILGARKIMFSILVLFFFLFKNDHPCRPLHCLCGTFSTLLIVGKFLPPGFGEEKRETKYQEDKISRDTKQNMKDQI